MKFWNWFKLREQLTNEELRDRAIKAVEGGEEICIWQKCDSDIRGVVGEDGKRRMYGKYIIKIKGDVYDIEEETAKEIEERAMSLEEKLIDQVMGELEFEPSEPYRQKRDILDEVPDELMGDELKPEYRKEREKFDKAGRDELKSEYEAQENPVEKGMTKLTMEMMRMLSEPLRQKEGTYSTDKRGIHVGLKNDRYASVSRCGEGEKVFDNVFGYERWKFKLPDREELKEEIEEKIQPEEIDKELVEKAVKTIEEGKDVNMYHDSSDEVILAIGGKEYAVESFAIWDEIEKLLKKRFVKRWKEK